MIYALLKILSRLTLWGYFRRVKIVGREKIPKTGPYIFVANHPSAFMDPIVVAAYVKPALYFIAAGEYVGKGLKGWIFRHVLHMIPVYRPSTRPEEAHKNKDMFVKCYEHLSKRGALLIFPEGVSLTEKKLKPLKTGAVRIALGAEAIHAFKLGVPIIPIGLNYSDPHRFRSDLFVKISEPIYVNDYINTDKTYNKEAEIELTQRVTALLQTEMQNNILHITSNSDAAMLEKLEAIYSKQMRTELNIAFEDQEGEFEMQKDFIEAISYFKKNQPKIYADTEFKIDEYLHKLDENGLSDRDIGEFAQRYKFRRRASYVLGLPYFVFGLIHNYIPYRGVGFLGRRIKLDETFTGSITLAIGLFGFLFWYAAVSVLMGYLILGWWAVLYPVLMYITGLYALIYSTAAEHSLQRKKLRNTVKNNQALIQNLKEERKNITTLLEACQKDYIAYKNEVS